MDGVADLPPRFRFLNYPNAVTALFRIVESMLCIVIPPVGAVHRDQRSSQIT